MAIEFLRESLLGLEEKLSFTARNARPKDRQWRPFLELARNRNDSSSFCILEEFQKQSWL